MSLQWSSSERETDVFFFLLPIRQGFVARTNVFLSMFPKYVRARNIYGSIDQKVYESCIVKHFSFIFKQKKPRGVARDKFEFVMM